ncbi:glutamate--tRNA ligase [Elioraea tepidiphila]|jgi:glutamyl-tRNA synthetase|uniref:glutamate--tRNA ligase n=1 Tax=Elioraea tepidiphila TaxID=457934 RepID=UPI000371109C|nr:glutamate--tRNA ligase [Elioraea tepidiphila]
MSEDGRAAVRVRFAPSPTGYLHVGNARVALANWLFARRHGGAFVLRLDDTDTTRCKPEYEAAIEEDLRWLGLAWDEGPIRQRDRLAAYAAAAERLKNAGRLYPCWESEEELAFKRNQRLKRGLAPIYDRAALAMTEDQRARAFASGRPPYWRFRLSAGETAWDDLVLGRRAVKLPAVSDPVLIRADGTPLYTFASVVDDLEMGITHIIRGEDHITNSGVQRDIMAALGADPEAIRLAHLPLLVGSEGEPLSKRIGSLSLRALRADGIEPAALGAYLARLGTPDDLAPADLATLAAGFDLGRISHSPGRFDAAQLLALNRKVLHATPFDAVRDRLPEGATEAFWLAVRGNLDLVREARHWWEVVSGTIVPPPLEGEGGYLRAAVAVLPPEPWDGATAKAWAAALAAATGRKGRALWRPLRLALTGEEHGPDMAALLPLIGRDRVVSRLNLAAGAAP